MLLRCGLDTSSHPRFGTVARFQFFFLGHVWHCSLSMNSDFRLMNSKKRVNSNFSHIKKLFCYSVFSFSKNKLYPNGPENIKSKIENTLKVLSKIFLHGDFGEPYNYLKSIFIKGSFYSIYFLQSHSIQNN